MTDEALVLRLEDAAIPYDPTRTPPPPDLTAPAEERRIGGLGVFLALQAVDSFRYEPVDGRNRSVLVMNRAAPAAHKNP